MSRERTTWPGRPRGGRSFADAMILLLDGNVVRRVSWTAWVPSVVGSLEGMHTTNLGSIGPPGRRPSHEQDSGIQRSHGRHCVACPASAEDSMDYRHVHRLDRMIHKQTLSFNNERFSGYSYEPLM